MNWSAQSWVVILLQVKTILSMVGIIISFLIRTRSYRYWMILSRRSYGCATETSHDTILRSQDLWDRILVFTPTRMEALSGRGYFSCEAFRKATETFYNISWILLLKVEYLWCCKLSLYDPLWDYDSNVDTYDILSLMDEWYAEFCMDTPSTFHKRLYYVLKDQKHDPDTPKYIYALSGYNMDEYFKTMDDKIQSLTRRDKW